MNLDYRRCSNLPRLQPHTPSHWKLRFAVFLTGLAAAMLSYVTITMFRETQNRLRIIENDIQNIHIDMLRRDELFFNKEYQPNAEDMERSIRRTQEVVTKAVHTKMTGLELELTTTKNDILQLRQTVVSLQTGLKQKEHTLCLNTLPKMNLINFALESMGATIDNIGATQQVSVENPPSMLMHRSRSAGDCFGFFGQNGEVVIRLQRPVHIDAVSIDHIPTSMSPNGTVETAPREFSVYGMNRNQNTYSHFFGTFQYDSQRQPLQLFTFPKETQTNRSFQLVHFKFLSNHGHPELTCVYQVGVHGDIFN